MREGPQGTEEGDCGGRDHKVQRKVTVGEGSQGTEEGDCGGRGHKVQRKVAVGGGATRYRGR